MTKEYRELSFIDDFMFCKILENNLDLCKELLEMILDIKIKKVICTSKQKAIEITSDGKGIRLDVYVEDGNNTVYDIEMQTTPQKDLPKRSRYYQGMIDLNLIERGAKYRDLKKSYIIFICLHDPFEYGLHLYQFSNVCKQIPELCLGDESVKVFLNAKGTADDISKDMKAFLEYLCGNMSENDFVNRIDQEVKKARNHMEWRDEYMTLFMRYQEKFEEGLEKGMEQGLEKGLEKGMEQGQLKRAVECVDGMITECNMDIEKACRVAKITPEEYREYKDLKEKE